MQSASQVMAYIDFNSLIYSSGPASTVRMVFMTCPGNVFHTYVYLKIPFESRIFIKGTSKFDVRVQDIYTEWPYAFYVSI